MAPKRHGSSIPCFAATFASLALILILGISSCAGRIDATLRTDGGARVTIRSSIPPALALRIRDFGKIPAETPLFDEATARSSLESRSGLRVVSIAAPTKESIETELDIADLAVFAAAEDIAKTRMATVRTGAGWTELGISLSRANAADVYRIIPGIDRRLIESLSPPALEEDPVTAAEYRMNLENAVIGKRAMPAFDEANVEIRIRTPAPILESVGGTISGQMLVVKLPLFDLLTLEKPVTVRLRWSRK